MSLYSRDIPDYKVKRIRLKKSAYPKSMIQEAQKVNHMNFTGNLKDSNKYVFRVSVLGIAVGIGLAMYHKSSIWGGAILGGIAGGFVGKVAGDYIVKHQLSKGKAKTETEEDEE